MSNEDIFVNSHLNDVTYMYITYIWNILKYDLTFFL